jgi:hypothetical protein
VARRNQAAAVAPVAPVAPVTPPSPAVVADHLLESIKKTALDNLAQAKSVIERFQAKLSENAAYAFEWSRDAFEAAAQQKVAWEVLYYAERASENGDEYTAPSSLRVVQAIRNELEREVLHAARCPSRSTSPQSNEMTLTLASRRAEMLDLINRRLEYRNLPR